MLILLYLALAVVISTIAYGLIILRRNETGSKKKLRRAIAINLTTFLPVIGAAILISGMDLLFPVRAVAAEGATASGGDAGLGYIAAAISTGLATIGAGYAVGTVGSSALGAVSEDPRILGKTLIFVGLAEGIAIYGLIVSIMILSRL